MPNDNLNNEDLNPGLAQNETTGNEEAVNTNTSSASSIKRFLKVISGTVKKAAKAIKDKQKERIDRLQYQSEQRNLQKIFDKVFNENQDPTTSIVCKTDVRYVDQIMKRSSGHSNKDPDVVFLPLNEKSHYTNSNEEGKSDTVLLFSNKGLYYGIEQCTTSGYLPTYDIVCYQKDSDDKLVNRTEIAKGTRLRIENACKDGNLIRKVEDLLQNCSNVIVSQQKARKYYDILCNYHQDNDTTYVDLHNRNTVLEIDLKKITGYNEDYYKTSTLPTDIDPKAPSSARLEYRKSNKVESTFTPAAVAVKRENFRVYGITQYKETIADEVHIMYRHTIIQNKGAVFSNETDLSGVIKDDDCGTKFDNRLKFDRIDKRVEKIISGKCKNTESKNSRPETDAESAIEVSTSTEPQSARVLNAESRIHETSL